MYSIIKEKCRSVSYRSIGQCHIETQVGVIEIMKYRSVSQKST